MGFPKVALTVLEMLCFLSFSFFIICAILFLENKKTEQVVFEMFGEKLNEYICLLGCSGKELAEACGLSAATVSRYRSGARVPKKDSGDVEKLCRGIALLAEQKHIEGITLRAVTDELKKYIKEAVFPYDTLQTKLNLLFSVLNINAADLSKNLRYDSSYLSRIRSGQRRPSDPEAFVSEIAEYIALRYDGENEKKVIAELLQTSADKIQSSKHRENVLAKWLLGDEHGKRIKNPMTDFLNKLNEFDLNEYIRAIHFDEIKVPTLPFQFPTSKSYYGLEEMKNGELDFLKATALSKSQESVFMCSDMQMDDMAADLDFAKKYMFGLAVMLKKGLHLNVVHNLNRPFHELMLGFESWIPLYMTGQISPYYLKNAQSSVYGHFLNISGSAALVGECIAGHHAKGKYYLTKNKEELGYYKERSGFILKKALPLMNIYREDSAELLNSFLFADSQKHGKRRNILSALPLYTMSEDYLKNILQKHSLPAADINNILKGAAAQRVWCENILEHDVIEDEIPKLDREEFARYPVALSLSNLFYENDILYTYEEYLEHLRQTECYAKSHANYSVRFAQQSAFRNIQIIMHEGEWVMISKNKAPAIHFVIRHPILRDAIENLVFPVIETAEV